MVEIEVMNLRGRVDMNDMEEMREGDASGTWAG